MIADGPAAAMTHRPSRVASIDEFLGTDGTRTADRVCGGCMGDVPSSLVVVVPARNEERRLNGCLLALRAAIQHFRP